MAPSERSSESIKVDRETESFRTITLNVTIQIHRLLLNKFPNYITVIKQSFVSLMGFVYPVKNNLEGVFNG